MSVNGAVVTTLGTRADPAVDVVALDGEPLRPPAVPRTIVLHKPRGVVTTLADPEGRPTVRALLVDVAERLYPVGRLDLMTSGLLLLTNDGTLAAALMHPRNRVPRVYHAKVRGTPGTATLRRMAAGVRLEDGPAAVARVQVLERLPTKTWLEITVREGRWRLVRRLCDAVGHPVEKLERVRLGALRLGTLPEGAWRDVSPAELSALRIAAGLSERGAAGAEPRRPAPGTPPRTPRRRSGRPRAGGPRSSSPRPPAAGSGGPRRPRGRRAT